MKVLILQALISCIFATEVCYPPCGCFNDDPPFNTRPLPESWEVTPITWLLYTQSNRNNPQSVTLPNVSPPPLFDPSKPTDFLIHGWTGNNNTLSVVRDSILDSLDHNVFVVDWVVGAGRALYPQSASNAQVTGSCSAYVASQLANMGDVHCVGYSVGGQVCGYMGYRSKSGSDPTMKRITGLDPAGPLFDNEDPIIRLDQDDADFVDVIHTNIAFMGVDKAVGDVDFFPNKGGRQPGCNNAGCDHDISRDYFAASISAIDVCDFNAYPCDNEEDADAGLCESCSGDDCQKQGFYADTMPGTGVYYLRTVEGYPFCES